MALFCLRGGWWAATNEVPALDETAHYGYVQNLADGHDPVTGKTTAGPDEIGFAKHDPVGYFQSLAFPLAPGPEWGITDANPEAFQPPLYYLLSVPVYALSRPFGALTALFALRAWTVLLASTAVPLLFLAGGELFPQRRAAWLLAPALLTGVEMVVSNLASVTNDAIMLPLGAAGLWALGRYFNRSSHRQAAVVGVVLGLGILGKTTGVALVAGALVAWLALLASRRGDRLHLLVGGTIAAAVMGVLVAPWLLVNEHQYHALTGIDANARIVEPVIGKLPRTWHEVQVLADQVRASLWSSQYGGTHLVVYRRLWEAALAATVIGGVVVSVVHRRFVDAGRLLWLVSIAPLGFAILVWSLFSQADGIGGILGRHLAVAVPALCLAMAAGAVIAARAWSAILLVTGFLVVSTTIEARSQNAYLAGLYTRPVFGHTAPVVNQPWADSTLTAATLRFTPDCPVSYVGLATPALRGALGPAVPTVTFNGKPLAAVGADLNFAVYALPEPRARPFTLTTSGSVPIDDSTTRTSPAMTVVGHAGTSPTARLYCAVARPAETRFNLVEHPNHPAFNYPFVRAWPYLTPLVLLAVGVWAAFAPLRQKMSVVRAASAGSRRLSDAKRP